MYPSNDKLTDELTNIKNKIKGKGTYTLLPANQWEEYANVLSNSGANILKDIEQLRDSTRDLKVPFLFFRLGKRLAKLEENYNKTAKQFDLFFDCSMRWIKTRIEQNRYLEHHRLVESYMQNLVNHCQKSIDYLSGLITSKRNQYHHYQILFISLIAILIAVLSLIISLLR